MQDSAFREAEESFMTEVKNTQQMRKHHLKIKERLQRQKDSESQDSDSSQSEQE